MQLAGHNADIITITNVVGALSGARRQSKGSNEEEVDGENRPNKVFVCVCMCVCVCV